MDTYLRLFLTIVALASLATCDTACESYLCGSISEPEKCHVRNQTDGQLTNNTLRTCNADSRCKFNPQLAPGAADPCEANPVVIRPSYAGGQCKSDAECQANAQPCMNETVCTFTPDNEACTIGEGKCNLGSVCRKVNDTFTGCAKPFAAGTNCTLDSECDVRSSCYNQKCTAFYSLKDGEATANANLCKSQETFFVGTDKFCTSYKSVNTTCTTSADCQYLKFPYNETAVTFPDGGKCSCAYAKNPTKVCDRGSADDKQVSVYNEQYALLNAVNGALCNEKEKRTICVEESKRNGGSFKVRKQQQKATNTRLDNHVLLTGADSCTRDVVFSGFNNAPIIPDTYKCPKYTCKDKQSTCYLGNNPLNEAGSDVNITLSNICTKEQRCSFEDILAQAAVNGTCVNRNESRVSETRLPGEDCDDTNLCMNQPGTDFKSECKDKKCTGIAFNEKCNSTQQCISGSFCNSTNICSLQLKDDAACSSSYDCENHLGCFSGKCTPLGKKPVGENLNVTTGIYNETSFPTFPIEWFCDMNRYDANYKCAQTNYTGPTEDKKGIDSNGFVKCDYGSECHYTDGQKTWRESCGCGFNKDGQGYCRLASAQVAGTYKENVARTVNVLKNTCHTESRFRCYKNDAKLEGFARAGYQKTVNAHLFYNAVDCASDVLGASFINMSVVLIAIIVAFLF